MPSASSASLAASAPSSADLIARLSSSSTWGLQDYANFATGVAAVIALFAMIITLRQYLRTIRLQQHIHADTMYLNIVNRLGAPGFKSQRADRDTPEYWSQMAILAATESLYILTAPNLLWEETVKSLLAQQHPFYSQSTINLNSFDESFRALLSHRTAA